MVSDSKLGDTAQHAPTFTHHHHYTVWTVYNKIGQSQASTKTQVDPTGDAPLPPSCFGSLLVTPSKHLQVTPIGCGMVLPWVTPKGTLRCTPYCPLGGTMHCYPHESFHSSSCPRGNRTPTLVVRCHAHFTNSTCSPPIGPSSKVVPPFRGCQQIRRRLVAGFVLNISRMGY